MKIIKLIKALLIVFSISLVLNSCQWVTVEQPEIVVPDVVSFSANIQPILTAKCITCHKAGGFASAVLLTEGDAYNTLTSAGLVNLSDPPSSIIFAPQTDKYPHTNHLSAPDKALILKWIEDGALNN
jgi:hypothetical protein